MGGAAALTAPGGPARAAPRVAADSLVYAVGDIHGRLDLLEALHRAIRADAAARPAPRRVAVYLGDYLSRGPSSRQVIDCLLAEPLAGFETVRLRGNHEDLLARFLGGDLAAGADWLDYGGVQALASYGLAADAMTLPDLRAAFAGVLPAAHRRFVDGLAISHREGDYYFVHAGVVPGVPLAAQPVAERMWIRRRFLESSADHGAVVVHGHSVAASPQWCANRIGIDTGAYASGVLSCLVLRGGEQALLQVRGAPLDLRFPTPHEGGGKGSV